MILCKPLERQNLLIIVDRQDLLSAIYYSGEGVRHTRTYPDADNPLFWRVETDSIHLRLIPSPNKKQRP